MRLPASSTRSPSVRYVQCGPPNTRGRVSISAHIRPDQGSEVVHRVFSAASDAAGGSYAGSATEPSSAAAETMTVPSSTSIGSRRSRVGLF
jgi:hypothetical protein